MNSDFTFFEIIGLVILVPSFLWMYVNFIGSVVLVVECFFGGDRPLPNSQISDSPYAPTMLVVGIRGLKMFAVASLSLGGLLLLLLRNHDLSEVTRGLGILTFLIFSLRYVMGFFAIRHAQIEMIIADEDPSAWRFFFASVARLGSAAFFAAAAGYLIWF